MTTDELRAKFEAWFSEGSGEHLDWMDHAEAYNDYTHDAMWQAFQAGHASRDADVEALRRDAERINWLALHPRGAQVVINGQATPCVFWGVSGHPEVTLREAIDAAMAKESGE